MNFLFWNTKANSAINDYLEMLIYSYNCDLVAIAEYAGDFRQLLRGLKKLGLDYYYVPKIGCKRIDLFVKFMPDRIEHLRETDYYTIKRIPHPTHGFIVAAFVHFPSPKNKDDRDRLTGAIRFRHQLEESEKDVQNFRTIVVGDFNSNPFEPAMLNADAFHSVPSRQIAKAGTRTVEKVERKMFYNPMWNFFGDMNHPSGTYYYRGSGYECVFWNIFDQVIVSPELMDFLDLSSIRIITEVQGHSLVNANGIPNKKSISDHLPLFFSIQ